MTEILKKVVFISIVWIFTQAVIALESGDYGDLDFARDQRFGRPERIDFRYDFSYRFRDRDFYRYRLPRQRYRRYYDYRYYDDWRYRDDFYYDRYRRRYDYDYRYYRRFPDSDLYDGFYRNGYLLWRHPDEIPPYPYFDDDSYYDYDRYWRW